MELKECADVDRVLERIFQLLKKIPPETVVFPIYHDFLLEIHSFLYKYLEMLEVRLGSFLFNRYNTSDPNRKISFSSYFGRQIIKTSFWKYYHLKINEIGEVLSSIEAFLAEYHEYYPLPKELVSKIHLFLAKYLSTLKNVRRPDIIIF